MHLVTTLINRPPDWLTFHWVGHVPFFAIAPCHFHSQSSSNTKHLQIFPENKRLWTPSAFIEIGPAPTTFFLLELNANDGDDNHSKCRSFQLKIETPLSATTISRQTSDTLSLDFRFQFFFRRHAAAYSLPPDQEKRGLIELLFGAWSASTVLVCRHHHHHHHRHSTIVAGWIKARARGPIDWFVEFRTRLREQPVPECTLGVVH